MLLELASSAAGLAIILGTSFVMSTPEGYMSLNAEDIDFEKDQRLKRLAIFTICIGAVALSSIMALASQFSWEGLIDLAPLIFMALTLVLKINRSAPSYSVSD